MYIPPAFRVNDFDTLAQVIRQNGFATVFSSDSSGVPTASHVPLLFDSTRGPQGTLFGHLARANPQTAHFASGAEVLCIFHGPHAYVSPSWYETAPAVPTWNYVAVHAYGSPRLIESENEAAALLRRLTQAYEAAFPVPWEYDLPTEYESKMIKAIIPFEIPVQRLEGAFKLSQNKPRADVDSVVCTLRNSLGEADRNIAALMAQEAEKR